MSTRSKVSSLLVLIGSAVLSAAAITAFMVYQYGPSGRYRAQHALLDPALIPVLSFNDTNSKTGGQSRFIFDKITFKYFDASEQKLKEVPVSLEKYQQFYALVQSELSLAQASEAIENLFERANPSELIVTIRTDSNAEWQNDVKMFQEVQFANEGNFYRIHLRQDQDPQAINWAYYQHPNIKNEVFKLFAQQQ